MTVTLGPGIGAVKTMKNCATLTGGTAQCATAPLTALAAGAPPPLLKIVKVSTSNGVCDLTKNCPFRITITNVGAGALQGDLDIGDTVAATSTAGAAQSVPAGVENIADPNWTCTKPDVRTIACKNPKGLAPGASVTLDILVTPGPSWKKNDILENCAVFSGILAPGSSLCASVKLDPFSVKITKGGDQSCKPGDECHFTLDIFDPGPIIHDAPVTVNDNLVGLAGAKIVSITQVSGNDAFPCSPAPTSLPFSCSGRMHMEVGEHNVYSMVVQLPADAPAQGSFSNCASVSEPKAGAAPGPAATGGTPGADQFCHQVDLEPACTGGMELTNDGRCACPAGTTWDGRSCATTPQCPAGTTGTYPNCQGTGAHEQDQSRRGHVSG